MFVQTPPQHKSDWHTLLQFPQWLESVWVFVQVPLQQLMPAGQQVPLQQTPRQQVPLQQVPTQQVPLQQVSMSGPEAQA
jgi:hypothetical protein